jgi:hypothetical protein
MRIGRCASAGVGANATGSQKEHVMDKYCSQEEISVKLLAAAAPDEVLVEAAKLRDRPAFAELWERHSSKPFKLVYRITKNREDAEDVIQDT